jgi:hypothetical protein
VALQFIRPAVGVRARIDSRIVDHEGSNTSMLTPCAAFRDRQ